MVGTGDLLLVFNMISKAYWVGGQNSVEMNNLICDKKNPLKELIGNRTPKKKTALENPVREFIDLYNAWLYMFVISHIVYG
jgi:hypothetical protein